MTSSPKKVFQECKSVQTWLTFTVYEKSGVCVGIFFSLLFLFLDFACGMPKLYNNHGCLKLNRMWPFASTWTATGGKSTEPGDGESTRGGGILLEKNADFSFHQQPLTLVFHQRVPDVGELDSISRSLFGFVLSNDGNHIHQVVINWACEERKVGLKSRRIHPQHDSWAAGQKHTKRISTKPHRHQQHPVGRSAKDLCKLRIFTLKRSPATRGS